MWMMPLHLHVNQKSDYDLIILINVAIQSIILSGEQKNKGADQTAQMHMQAVCIFVFLQSTKSAFLPTRPI